MSKSLTKDIARVVRGIMAQRQMQQKDLAAALGHHSSSNVSRWLKGGTFDADALEGMAGALGIEVDDLVRLALISRDVENGELSALLASFERNKKRPPNRQHRNGERTG